MVKREKGRERGREGECMKQRREKKERKKKMSRLKNTLREGGQREPSTIKHLPEAEVVLGV